MAVAVVDALFGAGWLAFWIYWLAGAVGVKAGRSRWRRGISVRLVIAIPLIIVVRTQPLHAQGQQGGSTSAVTGANR